MPQSIRLRMLWLLVAAVFAVWLIAGSLVYHDARHQVDAVYDANLAQSTRVLLGLIAHELDEQAAQRYHLDRVVNEVGEKTIAQYPELGQALSALSNADNERIEWADRGGHPGHRYEAKLALLSRYPNGDDLLRSPGAPKDPPSDPGFSNYEDETARWRVYTIVDPVSALTVQVAEWVDSREALVRHITLNAVLPLLAALPVLALLIWFAIGRGLRPLDRVAGEVSQRQADALEPIHLDDIPQEVRPLTDSLNALFERLDQALDQQRRFTADAAHELRTPLAVLSTQSQLALRAESREDRERAISSINKGVIRATHLVTQLLALAKADSSPELVRAQAPLALPPLIKDYLAEIADEVMHDGAELAFENGGGVMRGDEAALKIILRNLIDNALQYGGDNVHIVIVSRQGADGVELEVVDDGPGVPEHELERVLLRFHRGDAATLANDDSGSGLGLSIVQRLVELHGGTLTLAHGEGGRGLRVLMQFPLAD